MVFFYYPDYWTELIWILLKNCSQVEEKEKVALGFVIFCYKMSHKSECNIGLYDYQLE